MRVENARRDPRVTIEVPRVSPDWLHLREPADAAARSADLVDRVRRQLGDGPLVIHDLGSGTGSMGRWLAPQLPGPQHWVLFDRDPDLLEHAAARQPRAAVTVETRQRDITRLTDSDLAGASLITASALLDMFTEDEVERVVAACHRAGCPALLTISVIGQVELTPPDPLDQAIAAAFNAHQRRNTAGRTLLGPDAVAATAEAFRRRGVSVTLRSSPWRLGPDQADLTAEWLRGWLDAACEQQPELTRPVVEYVSRRFAQAESDQLGVVVHHHDLLAGAE
jgi:trans-aconitate methyltransferase